MSRRLSCDEALCALTCAAVTFGPHVKAAMELWLQATDELPRPLQQPSTPPVTPLIHAALREAPYTVTIQELKNVKWLVDHLPQISEAMGECVSSQLDVAAARISILRTLPGKEQQAARMEAEHNICLLLEVRTLAFFVILPVAAFCKAMALAVLELQCGIGIQPGRSKQQRTFRQGSSLISAVANSLRQSVGIRAQLFDKKAALQRMLPEGDTEHTPDGHASLMIRIIELEVTACEVWLNLVTTLPPSQPDVLLFLDHVDWEWLQHTHIAPQEVMESLLTQVCLEYGLLSYLWERQPPIARLVLEFLGVYEPDRMQAYGLPAAAQPIILACWLRKAYEKWLSVKPNTVTRSGSHNSQAADKKRSASSNVEGLGFGLGQSNSARTGDGSSGSAHDSKEQLPGEEDSNDMQSLVRMMYGYSVKDGQVQV